MKRLACLLVVFQLSACVQLYVQSGIELTEPLSDDSTFAKVSERIEEKARELGAACELKFDNRNYIQCWISNYGEVDRIFAGVSDKGGSFVAVQSIGSSYFVVPEEELRSGALPVDRHSEMETWVFSSFQDLSPSKKYRKFNSREIELEFE